MSLFEKPTFKDKEKEKGTSAVTLVQQRGTVGTGVNPAVTHAAETQVDPKGAPSSNPKRAKRKPNPIITLNKISLKCFLQAYVHKVKEDSPSMPTYLLGREEYKKLSGNDWIEGHIQKCTNDTCYWKK